MLFRNTLVVLLFLLSSLIFCQSFKFEYSFASEGNINFVGDINGDDITEFVETVYPDTILVFSGIDGSLEYSINGKGYFPDNFDNSSSSMVDFNGNNVKDFFLANDSDCKVYLIDLSTNEVLFEYTCQTSPSGFKHIYVGDFNNDSKLDVLILEERIGLPHYYLHTVYSTDVRTTQINETRGNTVEYELYNNFPNPFNPSTTIRYSIDSPEKISIKIYNVSGQLIKEINREHNQAGKYEVIWDGKNNFGQKVSSGAYFYQLTAGNYTEAKKMILLK